MSAATDPFAAIGAKPVGAQPQVAASAAAPAQNADPFASIGAKPVAQASAPAAAAAGGAAPAEGEDKGVLRGAYNVTVGPMLDLEGKEISSTATPILHPLRTAADRQQTAEQMQQLLSQGQYGEAAKIGLSTLEKDAPSIGVIHGLINSHIEQGKATIDSGKKALEAFHAGRYEEAQGYLTQAQGNALATAVPIIGPAAAQAGRDFETKPKEATGEMLGLIGSILAPEAIGKMGGKIAGKVARPLDYSEAQVASKITDAVNPPAKDMPSFSANVTKHASAIEDYAVRNNIPLQSVGDFAKAAKGVAAERTAFYYQQILNPIKNELVGTSEIPNFGGEKIGEGATMTDVGKLDSRLVSLNKMLESSYEGGGMTTEMKQGLEAEARGIRKVLFETMGKKLNVPAEAIAKVRGSIGELNSLADTSELSVNQARHAKNVEASKPVKISLNPLNIHGDFVLDKIGSGVANKGINAVRGVPADNLVKEAFQHLNAEPAELPKPSAQQPGTRPAKPPAWRGAAAGAGDDTSHLQKALQEIGGGKNYGELSTADQSRVATRAQELKDAASPNGKASIGEQMKAREAERAAQDAAKEKQTAKRTELDKQRAAEREKAASNRASHGRYKQAEKALGAESGE